jgi:dUTP pyrophosphatase
MTDDAECVRVKFRRLHQDAKRPEYATAGAAGFDLRALTVDGYTLSGSVVNAEYGVVCGTGLAFEIPKGWAMLLLSRSGHGFNYGVSLANAVGLIDSDYRGEVKVKLVANTDGDAPPLRVDPGDRIAQAILVRAPNVVLEEVAELSDTARGVGGMGSTGQA